MSKITRLTTAVILTFGAAALATTAPGAAGAAGSFDGIYKGSAITNTQGCYNRTHIVLTVRNNHFNRHWADAEMNVDVAGDGTFSAGTSFLVGDRAMRHVTINGKIADASLEADFDSERCTYHMSLRKS
jgi:hypothetical protein